MVHTLTVLTLQLAEAIGLYWLAAGIGLLLVPQKLGAIVADFERSPGLVYAIGIAAFAIGTAILIPHHVFYDPLSVIVTVRVPSFSSSTGEARTRPSRASG